MQALKTCLMVLISIILIITGWVYLAAMAVERTVLSPAYYRGMCNNVGVASYLHTALEEGLYNRLPRDLPAEVREIMVTGLAQAFPEEWVEEQFLITVNDVLALVKGKQENLSAVIDLREGKDRYEKELVAKLARLPASRLEILELYDDEIEAMVQRILKDVNLPDQIMLATLLERQRLPGEFEEAVSLLRKYRAYYLYTPYVLFVLFLLLYYLLAGWFKGLKWFGTAYLISGITFYSFLLLTRAALISPLIAPPRSVVPLDAGIFSAVVRFTMARISTMPLVFAIAGLLLLVGGIVLEKRFGDKTGADGNFAGGDNAESAGVAGP